MRWSKNILKSDSAEKVILDFVPKTFDLGTPIQALEYLVEKKIGSDFRMNDVLREQTGIDKLEQGNEEQIIEEKALEKFKEVQEAAYAEAYKLGLDEGRKSAFEKSMNEISQRLQSFDQFLLQMAHLKSEMEAHNEAHLIRLVYHMASRIAMTSLAENNQAIVDVLKQAVQLAQDEENIRVQVAPSQFEFMEEVKKQTGREVEFLKKMKLEPNPEVTAGGCIIETNYGEVDARVEQRLEQLWGSLLQNMPKVKDVIGG